MAKTKVEAPEGYHFMIKRNGNFYLQKGKYTRHTLKNGDRASEFVELEYLTEHPSEMSTGTTTTSTSVRPPRPRPPRSSTPASTRVVKRSSSSSSSTSSGSSSGGGY